MNNSRHKLEKSTCVQNLAYADDILITSSNIESLQCLVEAMNNIFAKFALKINFKKTKFMCILPDNTENNSINGNNNIRNNIDHNNNKNIKINRCRNDEKNTRYNNRKNTTNNKNNTNDNKNNDNINKNNKKDNSNKNPDATATLSIGGGGNYLEKVTQFKYLGSILSSDNSVDTEVEARINRAAQAFRTLSRLVWYNQR